ncbi:MAG: DUF5320 domain-containing protein [Clostridia bacterium]|nr:DUF5320 domain-containing protein [Clostridia bacterium]
MPGGDGTGPAGMGPMTGRGAGYCAGYNRPGFANFYPRYGMGRGRGYRNMYYATGLPRWARYDSPASVPYNQEEMLMEQQSILEEQLEAIKKEIQNLKGDKNQEEE